MFWSNIIGIIAFVFILGLIVLVHEGGHFLFAKRAGILCYEFSIGMGPVIWQTRKGETVYSIRAIPIGGYVQMAGEEIDANPFKNHKEVKLLFEKDRVVKIILDLNNPDYLDLPTYTLIEQDLIGSNRATHDELYLVVKDEMSREYRFTVDRKALINFNKKQTFQIAPYDRTFTFKTLGQRFSAVFAGPLMNFILAILIFFIIGLVVGFPNEDSTILDVIEENTPAYQAGLRTGDQIIEIDGEDVTVWNDVSRIMSRLASGEGFDGSVEVTYKRNGTQYTTTVKPYVYINSVEIYLEPDGSNEAIVGAFPNNNDQSKSYKAGLRKGDKIIEINGSAITSRADLLAYFETDPTGVQGGEYKIKVQGKTEVITVEGYSKAVLESQNVPMTKVQLMISPGYEFHLGKALYMPFVETGNSALVVFRTLGMLFTDKTVGVGDLSGPLGILTATTSIAKSGFISLLNWTAILSVNIGLLNILPLPALDGGRLAFIGYEAVTKKKPNAKVENTIHMIGFILFMLLFVIVTFSDVMRCAGLK